MGLKPKANMRLVMISGRSGSGKTQVLHFLEDWGFYCIVNLPIGLLSSLPEHLSETTRVAISIDARNFPGESIDFKKAVDTLKKTINGCEMVYLDAEDHTLLKRFSGTRRKHPLSNPNRALREAIQLEGELLSPIAQLADFCVDTSQLSIPELKDIIRHKIHQDAPKPRLQVLLQSFGFKKGLPPDADFVFDVRCIKNPYWQAVLREQSGLDLAVANYLEEHSQLPDMRASILAFIRQWLPQFEADNRSYLTIAIGCTGGKHRSVYLVESLGRALESICPQVQIRHREL